MEGVNEKSQWRKPAREQESGRRGGESNAENRRAGPPKQTRHGRVRHLRAQPHSGTLEYNLGQQPSTHWERAPPGVHPSCEGGGGPVVQAGGTGAGRVAQAGAGSWCQRADTRGGVQRNPRRRGVPPQWGGPARGLASPRASGGERAHRRRKRSPKVGQPSASHRTHRPTPSARQSRPRGTDNPKPPGEAHHTLA